MMKGKFLDVGKGKVYYEILKKKKMLVFLHAQTLNMTSFKPEIEHFKKKGYGILALDCRGEGKSTQIYDKDYYKLDNYVSDIEKIFKKEGINKATLIGYSMGGLVAQAFAAKNPKQVSGLVLLSTSYCFKKTIDKTLLKILIFGLVAPLLKNIFYILQKVPLLFRSQEKYIDFSDEIWKNAPTTRIHFMQLSRSPPEQIRIYKFQAPAMLQWDTRTLLNKIEAPTFIMAGGNDWIIKEKTAWELHNGISNSEFPIIVPGMNHDMIFKAKDVMIEFIEDFLRRRVP